MDILDVTSIKTKEVVVLDNISIKGKWEIKYKMSQRIILLEKSFVV
jgi:hypothetical protein